MLEKYSYELWNGNCLELMKSIPDSNYSEPALRKDEIRMT